MSLLQLDAIHPIFKEAKNGNTEAIQLLIENDETVAKKTDARGRTPLAIAARKGHTHAVRILINKSNIELKDFYTRRTPLFEAARYGHVKIFEILMINGADVRVIDSSNDTLCSIATKHGHETVVRILHAATDNVDASTLNCQRCVARLSQNTGSCEGIIRRRFTYEVLKAIKQGKVTTFKNLNPLVNFELLRAIIEYGDRVFIDSLPENEVKHVMRHKLLLFARVPGSKDVLNYLFHKFADIEITDRDGNTLLALAAQNGNRDVVEALLNVRNINVEAYNYYGETPYYHAVRAGKGFITKLLLEKGKARRSYKPSADFFAGACSSGNEEDIQPLVENIPADINHLRIAAHNGHTNLVRMFLDMKVDVNSGDGKDPTALMSAAQTGQIDVVKQLLQYNADIKSRYLGYTALQHAVKSGHIDVVDLLLKESIKSIDVATLTVDLIKVIQLRVDKDDTIDTIAAVIETFVKSLYTNQPCSLLGFVLGLTLGLVLMLGLGIRLQWSTNQIIENAIGYLNIYTY